MVLPNIQNPASQNDLIAQLRKALGREDKTAETQGPTRSTQNIVETMKMPVTEIEDDFAPVMPIVSAEEALEDYDFQELVEITQQKAGEDLSELPTEEREEKERILNQAQNLIAEKEEKADIEKGVLDFQTDSIDNTRIVQNFQDFAKSQLPKGEYEALSETQRQNFNISVLQSLTPEQKQELMLKGRDIIPPNLFNLYPAEGQTEENVAADLEIAVDELSPFVSKYYTKRELYYDSNTGSYVPTRQLREQVAFERSRYKDFKNLADWFMKAMVGEATVQNGEEVTVPSVALGNNEFIKALRTNIGIPIKTETGEINTPALQQAASSMVLAAAATLNNIKTFKYTEQNINSPKYREEEETYSLAKASHDFAVQDAIKKRREKGIIQATTENKSKYNTILADLKSENSIRALIDDITRNLKELTGNEKFFNTGKANSRIVGAGIANFLIEQGVIDLGVNKNGVTIPIEGPNNIFMGVPVENLVSTYLSSSRADTNIPMSFTPIVDKIAMDTLPYIRALKQQGKLDQSKRMAKVQENYYKHQGQVPNLVDLNRVLVAEAMFNDVLANQKNSFYIKKSTGQKIVTGSYYDSPFASTLGELTKRDFDRFKSNATTDSAGNQKPPLVSPEEVPEGATWEEASQDREDQLANRIIEDKVNNIRRNLELAKEKVADGQRRFYSVKASDATGRWFIVNEGNIQLDKKMSRPVMAFVNDPIVLDSNEKFNSTAYNNRVKRLANQVFLAAETMPGGKVGEHVHRKIASLSKQDRLILGYHYSLGQTMLKEFPVDGMEPQRRYDINRFPRLAIEHSIDRMSQALELGKKIDELNSQLKLRAQSKTDGTPTVTFPRLADGTLDMDPQILEMLTDNPGEWQYPYSILEDTHLFSEADKNRLPHRFSFVYEEDGKQSNATNISMFFGGIDNAKILGMLPETTVPPYKDLREKLYSGVVEASIIPETKSIEYKVGKDVLAALDSQDDINEGFQGAVGQFFIDLSLFGKNNHGFNASKVVFRRPLVAGLYGKTFLKMYSEVTEILNTVPEHISNKLTDFYESKFPRTPKGQAAAKKRLFEDMSNVFAMGAQNHLAELSGYQSAMRALAPVMAILRADTEYNGILEGTTFNIGADTWLPIRKRQKLVNQLAGIETTKVGDISVPNLKLMKDPAAASDSSTNRARLAQLQRFIDSGKDRDEPLALGVGGTQLKNGLPVLPIQNSDSAMINLATLFAQSGDPDSILNIINIHDASIMSADSVLFMTNAYNNIAPKAVMERMMGKVPNSGGNAYFEEMLGKFDVALSKATSGTDEVNIGTQNVLLADGKTFSSYNALTETFDELYRRTLELDPFFSETEKERSAIRKTHLSALDKNIATVAAAKANGYIGLDDVRVNDNPFYRSNVYVSKEQFVNLIQILREHLGISDFKEYKFLIKYGYNRDYAKNDKPNKHIVNLERIARGTIANDGRKVRGLAEILYDEFNNKKGPSNNMSN